MVNMTLKDGPMAKKAGVILVNYKDYVNRFLAECRDTLRQQDYPAEQTNVYIVDNASTQETRAYIRDNYPEAIVVPRQDGNYAAANNAGIRQARQDGCDYFVIANMDTAFAPDWLSELVKALETDSAIGFAQSKMLLYPQTEQERQKPRINSLGNIMNYLGFGFTSAYREPDRQVSGLPDIGYASGCSFITSQPVIDRIGCYDEEYWMYHDDIEMSWRVKLAGYRIVLAPRSVVYHKYEFGRSVRMLYYMERNRLLAVLHYYKWQTLLLILPAVLAMEAGMFAYSIAGKWFGTKLKATGYLLCPATWKKILGKRKQVAALRQVKDREVVQGFYGQVLFQEIENPVLKYLANPAFGLYWKLVKKVIQW